MHNISILSDPENKMKIFCHSVWGGRILVDIKVEFSWTKYSDLPNNRAANFIPIIGIKFAAFLFGR